MAMNYTKSKKIVDRIKSVTGLENVEISHQSNIPKGGYTLEVKGTLSDIEMYAECFLAGFRSKEI